MVALASFPRWTVEQYLAMERCSDVRHEYVDGLVYALAGGTRTHSVIAATVTGLLYAALRGGPCRVYSSDLKVRVSPTHYLYPDVSVGCEVEAPGDDADWTGAPRVVVEVLSDSTAAYDRGDKFALYRQLPSLRAYVLVETDCRLVEVRGREEGPLSGAVAGAGPAAGGWTVRRCGPGEMVDLPALGVQLAVDAIYAGVTVD